MQRNKTSSFVQNILCSYLLSPLFSVFPIQFFPSHTALFVCPSSYSYVNLFLLSLTEFILKFVCQFCLWLLYIWAFWCLYLIQPIKEFWMVISCLNNVFFTLSILECLLEIYIYIYIYISSVRVFVNKLLLNGYTDLDEIFVSSGRFHNGLD